MPEAMDDKTLEGLMRILMSSRLGKKKGGTPLVGGDFHQPDGDPRYGLRSWDQSFSPDAEELRLKGILL